MKKIKFILTLFILLTANLIFSAPAPPPTGGSTGTPACWPPPCVPIDGGIVFLIALGIIYAAVKIYLSRQSVQQLL